MKQYKKYLIIFIILAGIVQTNCQAQDSLLYYLGKAASDNPALKAKYLEYTASLEKVPQSSSLPDPQLQFGYLIKPMELLGGNQVADISLMQMFPWFGELRAAKDEASKMAVSKFDSFMNSKNELYFNVKAVYYTLYRTEKEISIAKKNLDILHSIEQIALVRFSTGNAGSSQGKGSTSSSMSEKSASGVAASVGKGMSDQNNMGAGPASSANNKQAPPGSGMSTSMGGNGNNDMVNLLRVQIEIHDLENRIAFLKDQLTTYKASFNRYLNRPPSYEVFTGDTLTVPSDILTMKDSLANHPMIKMYEAESEANSAKLKMVTRMGYPMLGLGVNYMIIQKREGLNPIMNGKDMIMPMVNLTIPIYRKRYKAMRREAEMMRDASSEYATSVSNDLNVNFQEALKNFNDASRRIKLYSDEEMLADKSLQLLLTSYSSSGADFDDVLRMEQQLLDYQFKKVEAVTDKNTSIASLVYLTGN
jgi:outer membrane protein TolC